MASNVVTPQPPSPPTLTASEIEALLAEAEGCADDLSAQDFVERLSELHVRFPRLSLVNGFVRLAQPFEAALQRFETIGDSAKRRRRVSTRATAFVLKVQELLQRQVGVLSVETWPAVTELVSNLAKCHRSVGALQFNLVWAVTSGSLERLEVDGSPRPFAKEGDTAAMFAEYAQQQQQREDQQAGSRVPRRGSQKKPLEFWVDRWAVGEEEAWSSSVLPRLVWTPGRRVSMEHRVDRYKGLTRAQLLQVATNRGFMVKKAEKKRALVKMLEDADIAEAGQPDEPQSEGSGPSDDELLTLPRTERTMILGNLPFGVVEEEVEDALSACGPVLSIELVKADFLLGKPRVPGKKEYVPVRARDELAMRLRPTRNYAIVEFAHDEGLRQATRPAAKIFGIMLPDVDERGRKVGRACYPQEASVKTSLVVRRLPWHLSASRVLEELARAVDRSTLLHGGPALCLSDRGVHGSATAGPSATANRGNDGLAVLRCESFAQAYLLRQRLQGCQLLGRELSCEFGSKAPVHSARGASGEPLDVPRMVDAPITERGLWF